MFQTKPHIKLTTKGVILFDDTVKDKCYAKRWPSCVGNTVALRRGSSRVSAW